MVTAQEIWAGLLAFMLLADQEEGIPPNDISFTFGLVWAYAGPPALTFPLKAGLRRGQPFSYGRDP